MKDDDLFVVTVASEKGGVGKTTVATNLAVYLKALREDLPVAIASFDNHFTVESMFAIGGRRGATVADLFRGTPAEDLLLLGEYGVQFISSDHGLTPPDDDPMRLCRILDESRMSGILILDTRPVLDYFTRNALLAADLVLVPVKDRPSLVNASSIHHVLGEAGADRARIWILPSIIDRRLRLRADIGMADFLTFSARERGYQVLDIALSKSPSVERLTTNFTSRVHPVITHAGGTAVHLQLRDLAEFVLRQADAAESRIRVTKKSATRGMHRFTPVCPLCAKETDAAAHFYQALSRRGYGAIHPACLAPLLEEVSDLTPEAVLLAFFAEGASFNGLERCGWVVYDDEGRRISEDAGAGGASPAWRMLLEGVRGASCSDMARECLLVSLHPDLPERFLRGERKKAFSSLRRTVLSELSLS